MKIKILMLTVLLSSSAFAFTALEKYDLEVARINSVYTLCIEDSAIASTDPLVAVGCENEKISNLAVLLKESEDAVYYEINDNCQIAAKNSYGYGTLEFKDAQRVCIKTLQCSLGQLSSYDCSTTSWTTEDSATYINNINRVDIVKSRQE